MNRSFSVDWWVWLFLTGASIGAVTRYFFFSLSRHKQSDRSQRQDDRPLRHGSGWLVHNRRPLGKIWRYEDVSGKVFVVFCISYSSLTIHPARSSKTLGCPYTMPYHCPDSCLHDVVQNPFHGSQPFWTRRCTNEFPFPSQP